MARYIDADELYKATQKRIAEANEARMAVVDDEFLDLINDAFTEDVAPRAEVDELIHKLECLLCYATGSKLSYHTYTLSTMESAVTDYIQECYDEAYDEARAEVAREIFEEIQKMLDRCWLMDDYGMTDMMIDVAELKKKYTGG